MRKKREKNVSLSHIFSNQKETVNWVPPPVFACARALRVHVCGFEPGSALYARRSDVAGEGRRGHPGWTTVRRGGQLQRRFENGTETGEIRIETKPKLTCFFVDTTCGYTRIFSSPLHSRPAYCKCAFHFPIDCT